MSIETKNKTVKVPTFNGEESNYQRWWIMFKSHAKLEVFNKALELTPESDLPGIANDLNDLAGENDNTKKQKSATKRNDAAMSSLTLEFTTYELYT